MWSIQIKTVTEEASIYKPKAETIAGLGFRCFYGVAFTSDMSYLNKSANNVFTPSHQYLVLSCSNFA